MYQPILSKSQFVPLYAAGHFGNGSPTWLRLEDFVKAEHDGLYHLRNGYEAGGVTFYKQTAEQVIERWSSVENPGNWYCSKQVPPEVESSLLIQGEVMQAFPGSGRCGLELYYTTVKKPMREALATRADMVSGMIAGSLLRRNLDANSYDWLMELLTRYPYHVVEFSTYRKCWGTLWPLYNTVFWECRNY